MNRYTYDNKRDGRFMALGSVSLRGTSCTCSVCQSGGIHGAANGKRKQCEQQAEPKLRLIKPCPRAHITSHRGTSDITIGIDPGHGGENQGAQGNGIKESDYNLDFAYDLDSILCSHSPYNSYLIRSTDIDVSLWKRGKISSLANCDLVVSLHVDSNTDTRRRGASCYYNRADADSFAIASHIMSSFPHPLKSRRDLYGIPKELDDKTSWMKNAQNVLKYHECPAVLVELGFCSNPKNATQLQSVFNRWAILASIVGGISNYLVTTIAQR